MKVVKDDQAKKEVKEEAMKMEQLEPLKGAIEFEITFDQENGMGIRYGSSMRNNMVALQMAFDMLNGLVDGQTNMKKEDPRKLSMHDRGAVTKTINLLERTLVSYAQHIYEDLVTKKNEKKDGTSAMDEAFDKGKEEK